MGYSYQPLWNLLSKRGISKTQIKERLGISSSTLAKLSANKVISMEVLAKICELLDCEIEDIVEYKSEMEMFIESLKDDFKECGYTVYIDKYPRLYFKLSERQAKVFRSIEIGKIIRECEVRANMENYPNAGILGTSEVDFYPDELELVIRGSFAVTELFIPIFLDLCKR